MRAFPLRRMAVPTLLLTALIAPSLPPATAAPADRRDNDRYQLRVVRQDPDQLLVGPDDDPNTERVLILGDSLTWHGADNLAELVPGLEVDALRGRGVKDTIRLTLEHVDREGDPDVLVVALGTNWTPKWSTRDQFEGVTKLVGSKTRIVFVTPYRDARYGIYAQRWMRRYATWMHEIADRRARVCTANWRERVKDRPRLLRDGVHATRYGENVWAQIIAGSVKRCGLDSRLHARSLPRLSSTRP